MSLSDILVVADTDRGAITDITPQLLTAARQLADATGGQVVGVVLAGDANVIAEQLTGADRVIAVSDPLLTEFSPEPRLAALEEVIRGEGPRAVLFGSTSTWLDLAPTLAARASWPIVWGVTKNSISDSAVIVTANFCAGKMLAQVEITASPALLLVLSGGFPPTEDGRQPEIQAVSPSVPLAEDAVRFVEMILPDASDVDITQQDVLVAVGRGIGQEDNLEIAEELAEKLGGELCASRPVVDQGWLPTTRQVGKSGMRVKPKCYFALGISGAPEHVEGMTDSELIIAVNKDPQAPIFEVADYGVVGEYEDVVSAINEAIES